MAKKWNEFSRRGKVIGVAAALFGVFVLGNAASGIQGAAPVTTQVSPATQQVRAEPVTTYKEVVRTEAVPFERTSAESSSLTKGSSQVTIQGVDGVRTHTYKVTLVDGIQTTEQLLASEVTTRPTSEVTTIGTYVAPPVVDETNGASAKCRDGTLSYSANRRGTCSHHGGVAVWY